MIKVLIVDDEMLSRMGIKSLIAWNEKGYSVVGEAENGKKALQLIKELVPDIVILDIKMPLMNGIELIKQANKEPYPPAFIVLSSYDDFDYVKQALMLGAKDYFLKLELTPEQLLGALDRIWDERCREQKLYNKTKPSYVEQLSSNDYQIIKSNFLKELIQGRNCEEEIQSKLNSLGIILPKERLQCGVILINGMEVYQKYKKDERHLFQFAVENIVSEILLNYRYGHVVVSQSKEIIVIFADEELGDTDCKMHELMRSIMKALKVYLNVMGSVGISNIRNGYLSIKDSYKEAFEAANREIAIEDLNRYEIQKEGFIFEMNDFIKNFENVLHTSDMEEMKYCLGQMIGRLKRGSDISKDILKSLCSTLLLSVSNIITSRANDLEMEEVWGRNSFQSIEHLHTNFDFIVWFEELENSIYRIFNSFSDSSKLIHKAKQYIHKHYSSNVSLEGIAEELNISANYLSSLFRKETSEGVVEYMTRYRIDKAKEYLMTTDYRIYEIGQMVGYESEQYFSRVFKKVVGIPPAKFKL